MFTELYNHRHDLILEHFHHFKKKLCVYLPSLTIPPPGLRQPPAYFLAIYWPVLDIFLIYLEIMLGWGFKKTILPCQTILGSPAVWGVTASVA